MSEQSPGCYWFELGGVEGQGEAPLGLDSIEHHGGGVDTRPHELPVSTDDTKLGVAAAKHEARAGSGLIVIFVVVVHSAPMPSAGIPVTI